MFPQPVLQTKQRETTLSGITASPIESQTLEILHSTANGQNHNEAKDDSLIPTTSSHRHIQHQLTREKPLLTRLSTVGIQPHAAVHKKKETLLGALTRQMLFQGKEILRVWQI